MTRRTLALTVVFLSVMASGTAGIRAAMPQAGQTEAPVNAAGEWTFYIEMNQQQMFRGAVDQKGAKLTGYMSDEMAEYPATGTVAGSTMEVSWTMFQRGVEIKITVTGKIEKDSLTGTAKVGDFASNVKVTGQRTGG